MNEPILIPSNESDKLLEFIRKQTGRSKKEFYEHNKCVRCGAKTKGYKYCIECREKGRKRPVIFKED